MKISLMPSTPNRARKYREAHKNMDLVGVMLIEKIYKEIYSKMQEDTGVDDLAMSDRLSVLLETPIEELDKEKLELLLCSSSIIGQEQGFVSGFRFCIRLLAEAFG